MLCSPSSLTANQPADVKKLGGETGSCNFPTEDILGVQNFILLANFHKTEYARPQSLCFWKKIFSDRI